MIQMEMRDLDKIRLESHEKGMQVGRCAQAQALTQAFTDVVDGRVPAAAVTNFFKDFLSVEDAARLDFVAKCLQAYSEIVIGEVPEGLSQPHNVRKLRVLRGGKDERREE